MNDEPVVKRLNYFTNQFLVEKDFQDEQAYHREMRLRHTRLLHTPGIAEGLVVTGVQGEQKIIISAGAAIDSTGQEIVLLQERTVDLIAINANAEITIELTLALNQVDTDKYDSDTVIGFRRKAELPKVIIYGCLRNENLSDLLEIKIEPAPTDSIKLCQLLLGADGKIIELQKDPSARSRRAGVQIGDPAVNSITIKVPNRNSPFPSFEGFEFEVGNLQKKGMKLANLDRFEIAGNVEIAGELTQGGKTIGEVIEGKLGIVYSIPLIASQIEDTTVFHNNGYHLKSLDKPTSPVDIQYLGLIPVHLIDGVKLSQVIASVDSKGSEKFGDEFNKEKNLFIRFYRTHHLSNAPPPEDICTLDFWEPKDDKGVACKTNRPSNSETPVPRDPSQIPPLNEVRNKDYSYYFRIEIKTKKQVFLKGLKIEYMID